MKRTEEKDKLKQQQKKRTTAISKTASKERKEHVQKAKQAEKYTYSVLAEKDEKEVMDDDSVVFTKPYSSDHLPKGTLTRLPLF